MATVRASYGIDSFGVDLNFYVRHFWEEWFGDNVYEAYGGRIYQDVYAVNGFDGYDDLILALGGTGFGLDGWGNVNRGTVTGIAETLFDGPLIWSAQGIAVPAVALYRAALTWGNADDRAVMAQALAGHDLITLSPDDDRFEGWGGNDRMFGHGGNDRLFGGTGDDMLNGGWGHDRLLGGTGNDQLIGALGHDTLEGGTGADVLDGGLGRDRLFAGLGAMRDVFVFRAPNETAVGAQRDSIHQFRPGQDDIDLSAMDAHAGRAGNQAFGFSGMAAAAHSVWYVAQAGGVILRGDMNGNRTADFEIWLADAAWLGAGDVIL